MLPSFNKNVSIFGSVKTRPFTCQCDVIALNISFIPTLTTFPAVPGDTGIIFLEELW